MEERVRSFYASWGSTLKGEDDIRRISAELVAGDGAVLDLPFNTTDVAVVVKTDQITQKYLKHYERKHAER